MWLAIVVGLVRMIDELHFFLGPQVRAAVGDDPARLNPDLEHDA
jgi:hypothetical protein